MGNFNDSNVDGFDNVDGFGESSNIDGDDDFLSASGKDRRKARRAVRKAHRKDKKAVRKAKHHKGGNEAVITDTETQETVAISTDPSATNVDLPAQDGSMPNMEAIEKIAEAPEQPAEQGGGEQGGGDEQGGGGEEGGGSEESQDDGSADGYGNIEGFGDMSNAEGDENPDEGKDGEEPTIDESIDAGIADDNFLSASGKMRARRDAKKATKQAKRDAKVAKKGAKTALINARADAKTKGQGGLSGLAGLFAKPTDPNAPTSTTDPNAPPTPTGMSKGLKTGLWIAGGVAAVGLIFALVKMGKGSKQAA